VAAGIEPLGRPLTKSDVEHLLRRTQLGASPEAVARHVGRPVQAVVTEILVAAIASPPPARPDWYDRFPQYDNDQDDEQYGELSFQWFESMLGSYFDRVYVNGLAEKMALFWHNHFTTQFFDGLEIAPLTFRYDEVIRSHAFGSLQDFVRAVGLDPTMLVFLNGAENTVEAPNENYARELCELFTMGITDPSGLPNYTEKDISELARALTGYFVDEDTWSAVFDEDLYDTGSKTIFGRTGTWGYDDVVNLLFQERSSAIAHHICSKLYREFVYETPDPVIVAELAQRFEASGFKIHVVLQTLLQSAHFFDEQFHLARIKSPFEFYAGWLSTFDLQANAQEDFLLELVGACDYTGQALLNPPNVAGYPGYRDWLTTSSVPVRWDVMGFLVHEYLPQEALVRFVRAVHDETDSLAVFRLPVAIAETLVGLPLASMSIPAISAEWSGGNPIPDAIQQEPIAVHHLTKRMLAGIPWYEWDLRTEEAELALRDYVAFVSELPEFQLA